MNPPIIKEIFEYKDLEKVTLETGYRYYVDPDGNRLSSVTTILSETSDNPGLLEWRERVGNRYADAIMVEACNLGTLMHEHLECYVQNIDRPKGNNILRVLGLKGSFI